MGKTLVIKGAYWAGVAVGDTPYTFDTPVITITDNGVVNITAIDSLAIYYTTDGTIPTVNSILYSGEFSVELGVEVMAIASYEGGIISEVVSETYEYSVFSTIDPAYIDQQGTIRVSSDWNYGRVLIYKVTTGKTYRIYGPTPESAYGGLGTAESVTDIAAGKTISIDNTYRGIVKGEYLTYTAPSGVSAIAINDNYKEHDTSPYVTIERT